MYGYQRKLRLAIVLSRSPHHYNVFWVLADDCRLVMLPRELCTVVAGEA
jgi:hypothetical protein